MVLYRLEEWQGSSGLWYCEHTSTVSDKITKWIVPARLLGMDPADFIQWLIKEYKPDVIHHNEDCSFVSWAWNNQTQMRKYKNYINAVSRKKNFMI